MSWQIIKQPDGKLAVWSTGSDEFISIDNTPDDVTALMLDRERRDYERRCADIQARVGEVVAALESGKQPYHQFTLTWKEACSLYKSNHGKVFSLDKARKEWSKKESE